MTQTKVIIITGLPWSGKWTASDYLSKENDAVVYRFSDPLHALLGNFDIPNTRENLATLSQSLRKHFWEDIMGRWVLEFIEKNSGNLIILEWIRRIESLTEFKDLVDAIIWIESSPELRYERIRARGEKTWESSMRLEDLGKYDNLETELSLEAFRKIANIVVENTSTKESLYNKLDLILKHT